MSDIEELKQRIEQLEKQNSYLMTCIDAFELFSQTSIALNPPGMSIIDFNTLIAMRKAKLNLNNGGTISHIKKINEQIYEGLKKDTYNGHFKDAIKKVDEKTEENAKRELDAGFFCYEEMKEKDEVTKKKIEQRNKNGNQTDKLIEDLLSGNPFTALDALFGIPQNGMIKENNKETQNNCNCEKPCNDCNCEGKKKKNDWEDLS